MRIEFTGRNTAVPESLEAHAEKRLGRLDKIADHVGLVRVVVTEQRGRKGVEITADLDGTLIRGEVKGPDERTSFDSALEKLERQVRKFRAKLRKRGRETLRHPSDEEPEDLPEGEEEDSDEPRIMRTKSVSLKPMSPEEATLQMELVGHDFFLFRNSDTDLVSVVYKREHGGYGLLECET